VAVFPAAAGDLHLKYAVIVSRQGVRAPTWDTARLNEYSAQPWPAWGVAPGELTPHGRAQMKLMGAYYHSWLAREKLLSTEGCRDAARIYIWSDAEQRTRETGRAFAESLMPGCTLAADSREAGRDPIFSGTGKADPDRMRRALVDRLGPDPHQLVAAHKPAF
jgi:4-phytase/acid phosphatase